MVGRKALLDNHLRCASGHVALHWLGLGGDLAILRGGNPKKWGMDYVLLKLDLEPCNLTYSPALVWGCLSRKCLVSEPSCKHSHPKSKLVCHTLHHL